MVNICLKITTATKNKMDNDVNEFLLLIENAHTYIAYSNTDKWEGWTNK